MATKTYKIVCIGDSGVGKTSFIMRVFADIFDTKYNPTFKTTIRTITLLSNRGPIRMDLWDCPTTHRISQCYEEADMFLIFAALDDDKSQESLNTWIKKVENAQPDANIAICLTKSDMVENGYFETPSEYSGLTEFVDNFYIWEFSNKTTDKFSEVFHNIARNLIHDDNIKISR